MGRKGGTVSRAIAAAGGHARAAALSPERRREIALAGLQAVADRYCDGDLQAAQRWITARAAAGKRAAAERRRAAREAAKSAAG